MIMVDEHSEYSKEFPEEFNWHKYGDSHVATNAASDIIEKIKEDLKTKERILVPGLRKALNILAGHTRGAFYFY